MTTAVSLARCPSLSSCFPTFSPFASLWTMNAPIPLCRSAGSSVAKMVKKLAKFAFVIHAFCPFRT
jgi:hypothetical protein